LRSGCRHLHRQRRPGACPGARPRRRAGLRQRVLRRRHRDTLRRQPPVRLRAREGPGRPAGLLQDQERDGANPGNLIPGNLIPGTGRRDAGAAARGDEVTDALFTADFKAEPYWWEASPRPPAVERPLPAEADVVVVGSGYTGLSAALQTARGGRSTVVLERETAGWGCSSRNGGQISTSVKP